MGEGSVVGQILWGRKVQWAICNSNVYVNAMPERETEGERERMRQGEREKFKKQFKQSNTFFLWL
jgi:hypothetical protein